MSSATTAQTASTISIRASRRASRNETTILLILQSVRPRVALPEFSTQKAVNHLMLERARLARRCQRPSSRHSMSPFKARSGGCLCSTCMALPPIRHWRRMPSRSISARRPVLHRCRTRPQTSRPILCESLPRSTQVCSHRSLTRTVITTLHRRRDQLCPKKKKTSLPLKRPVRLPARWSTMRMRSRPLFRPLLQRHCAGNPSTLSTLSTRASRLAGP